MARDKAPPKVRFVVDEAEVTPTPQASALIVQRLLEQLGFGSLLSELGLDKNHGVPSDGSVGAEEIALILLLYSSYGVDSVVKLQEKARQDKALAQILPAVEAINEKVILYFEDKLPKQWEGLLDACTHRMQQEPRFTSRPNGVLALDDSPLAKTGKQMEEISVIYDHTTGQYTLGYVLVSTFYADAEKGYPVNFQFRLVQEEERREVGWPRLDRGSRTALLNGAGNRWKFEELCRITLQRQLIRVVRPVILETVRSDPYGKVSTCTAKALCCKGMKKSILSPSRIGAAMVWAFFCIAKALVWLAVSIFWLIPTCRDAARRADPYGGVSPKSFRSVKGR